MKFGLPKLLKQETTLRSEKSAKKSNLLQESRMSMYKSTLQAVRILTWTFWTEVCWNRFSCTTMCFGVEANVNFCSSPPPRSCHLVNSSRDSRIESVIATFRNPLCVAEGKDRWPLVLERTSGSNRMSKFPLTDGIDSSRPQSKVFKKSQESCCSYFSGYLKGNSFQSFF